MRAQPGSTLEAPRTLKADEAARALAGIPHELPGAACGARTRRA